MVEDIKEKIKNVLRNETYTERDVVYIFIEIYKLLEQEEKLEDFKTIKFYRNWVSHAMLYGDSRKIFEEVFIIIKNKNTKDSHSASVYISGIEDKILECFSRYSFLILKNELEAFSKLFLDGEKSNWDSIRKNLYKIVTDTPLVIIEDGKEILKFVCKSVIFEISSDDLEIEVFVQGSLKFSFTMNDSGLEDSGVV